MNTNTGLKGQVTLEFIGSALFFLTVVIAIMGLAVNEVPNFYDDSDTKSLNLEAKYITDYLLKTSGEHNYDGGGSDWERNEDTLDEVLRPGFKADDRLRVDRDKIESMGTAGDDVYSYNEFSDYFEPDHSYSFVFTWYPIVETHETFTRTRPPEDPEIEEPLEQEYDITANRVHYGSIDLNGETVKFLVTAIDGQYANVYVSDDWDFREREHKQEGEVPEALSEDEIGQDFEIAAIQNRDERPGAIVVLQSHVNEFGPSDRSASGDVIKMNRYPIMDDPQSSNEIVKMEVFAW